MKKTVVAAAIGLTVAGTAIAQTSLNRSQEEEAIAAITEVGGTCERIIRNQTVGELDDRSTLMAMACDGGEEAQYVLQLDRLGNMTPA